MLQLQFNNVNKRAALIFVNIVHDDKIFAHHNAETLHNTELYNWRQLKHLRVTSYILDIVETKFHNTFELANLTINHQP